MDKAVERRRISLMEFMKAGGSISTVLLFVMSGCSCLMRFDSDEG